LGSWSPPEDDLVVGWVDEQGSSHLLPFFRPAATNLEAFAAGQGPAPAERHALVEGLMRDYEVSTDTWRVGPLRLRIATPHWPLPEPSSWDTTTAQALLPALCVELTLAPDPKRGPVALVFGLGVGRAVQRLVTLGAGCVGVTWDGRHGVASDTEGAESWVHVDEAGWVRERACFGLGTCGGVGLRVGAGQGARLRLVLGAFSAESATSQPAARAAFARYFDSLSSVLRAALDGFEQRLALAESQDRQLAAELPDEHQRFLVVHATRSYWGNSVLTEVEGHPRWTVFEGEYAMMNTLDLSVDHLFFELFHHPWLLRSVCDQFIDGYSYRDTLARPGSRTRRERKGESILDPLKLASFVDAPSQRGLPGGISFCHDMGVQGLYSLPGTSSYERSRLTGCFSYMSAEQLCNFVLCAVSYALVSGDEAWLAKHRRLLIECHQSMLNRDDPDPARRDGLVGLDSERCGGGWEITTYDSLDPSLGQARASLYLAVKYWAAWLGLQRCFELLGEQSCASESADAALRVARSVPAKADAESGALPALLDGSCASLILPAVEGLVFPWFWQLGAALDRRGAHAPLLDALERHLRAALSSGACLTSEGGWRLSSSSNNTWQSKVVICQVVAQEVFGITPAPESHATHARWQQVGSRLWAFCDQIVEGQARGSRYYPRGVTAQLWLWAARRRRDGLAGVASPEVALGGP